MTKIWKLTTRICFDTIYFVVSKSEPNFESVIDLAKNGHVPEFSQEPAGPEYGLNQPEEISEADYLSKWSAEIEASKEEKLRFLVNLDVMPPEDLSLVAKEMTLGSADDITADPLTDK